MLSFSPLRDFNMACVPPEMPKTRRVVVVSPRSYNYRVIAGRDAANNPIYAPGKCVVVPFSATAPRYLERSHVPFAAGQYKSLTLDTWAICEMVDHVSHDRLDRVKRGQGFLNEFLSAADMVRVEDGFGTPWVYKALKIQHNPPKTFFRLIRLPVSPYK